MLPVNAPPNHRNIGEGDAVIFGDGGVSTCVAPDCEDIGFCEFGKPVPRPCRRAPLGNHVGIVIGGRAEKQVRRVTARRIIAAVKHPFAGRDGAVGQLPSDAMGLGDLIPELKYAVAVAAVCPTPRPTIVRRALIGFRPKPIRNRRMGCRAALVTARLRAKLLGPPRFDWRATGAAESLCHPRSMQEMHAKVTKITPTECPGNLDKGALIAAVKGLRVLT